MFVKLNYHDQTGWVINFIDFSLFKIQPDPTMYVGRLGERISLPCNTTPTTGEDQVALLLFYKEPPGTELPGNNGASISGGHFSTAAATPSSSPGGGSSGEMVEEDAVINKKVQPIYSLDARESPLNRAAQFAGQPLDGRATVQMSEGSSSTSGMVWLRIERLTAEDAGLYRCRVDYRRGRTINWLISLQVVGKCIFVCPRLSNTKLHSVFFDY